ncbi:uncharacterized protein B0H18DRAFT_970110 [Fomitopsis serialis]|uniref:uncharacterized protein n=1 Tax=Fomitopsis serialis TaxID=139415 RepID=UPI002007A6BB|nr:uncharacterized protein B0H18DRAFT_970110 [Neoantrodia serialis]KAH9937334.1 hypothetical protein B0H18DRAFT_970110 [Neoantrodia serialis]
MSGVSRYWTRFVIWIGRDPTPLRRVQEYLDWSRGRPLHIYILRRFDLRWRTLCMRLLQSSSLPRPRVDLVGRAKRLETLCLDSVVDDLVGSTETAPSLAGRFDTPALKNLSMCGVHFHESYVKLYPALAMPPQLAFLTITNYNSHNTAFPLIDLLACLLTCRSLCGLELNNLHLDCSYTGPSIRPMHPPYWHVNVDFVDIGGDVVAEYRRLLRHPFPEFTSYTRCLTPTPPGTAHPPTYRTKLEDIKTATLAETTPDPMAGPQDEAAPIWLCPNLQTLKIAGCTQFRSADLRAMLEARRAMHEATGFVEFGDPQFVVSSVRTLFVDDCCELASEDKEWLHANVPNVGWDDWMGGYEADL